MGGIESLARSHEVAEFAALLVAHPAVCWNYLPALERVIGSPAYTPDALALGKRSVLRRHRAALVTQHTSVRGCKWRALAADFPPWRTVWGFMARWAAAGIIGQIRDQLAGRIRRDMGKGPRAVATVIDSQSVKAAETVSKATRGYDAGKKINGRKRHLVVDTRGLPLLVIVTPADLHDAAAAKEVLLRLRLMHPEITIVWADSAYAGSSSTGRNSASTSR